MIGRVGLFWATSSVIALVLLSAASYGYGSSDPPIIDVNTGNQTYTLDYYMSNGGSIDGIYANDTTESLAIAIANTSGQDSDNDYYLDLSFPREFYDEFNFTEHSLVAFADGQNVAVDILESSTCSQIITRIHPIPANTQEIEILYADILGSHTHVYPPKLWLFKTIEVGQASNSTKFSVFLQTDAIGCNVSFSEEEKKIHIDIEGRNAEEVMARGGIDKGYLALNFPYDLLGGNYTVLVDGKPVMFNESQYFTKNYTDIGVRSVEQDDFTPIKASHLGFNYPMDAEAIDILGTTAAPEFSSISLLIVGAGMASVLAIFFRLGRVR